VTQIEKKRAAYGIEAEAVDGMDLMAVIDAADTAVQKVRSTGKPYLLVCNTYRFKAHSMFDAELWDQEIDEWKKKRFRSKLPVEAKWITTDEIIAFEQKIEAKVQLAVDGSGKLGAYSKLTKFTYSENKMQ
jgi:TPP-dependent pyruvate/acetoin dehydrogenase alpha subunit